MSPNEFALCLWFLMLACFLSGCGQNAADKLHGKTASLFKPRSLWVINAFLSFRGIWALLQIIFFSKWFSVERLINPKGLSWDNGYLWVAVVCTLILLNQLARMNFPKNISKDKEQKENQKQEEDKSKDESTTNLAVSSRTEMNLNLIMKFCYFGSLGMFGLAFLIYILPLFR